MRIKEILDVAIKEYSKRSTNDYDVLVFRTDYDALVFVRDLIKKIEREKLKNKADHDTLNFLYESASKLEKEIFGGTGY